jgi:hypothetical protein
MNGEGWSLVMDARRYVMKSLTVVGCALVVLGVMGCSSDTSPDSNGEAQYPDIPGLVVFYNFDGDLNNAVSELHHGTIAGEAIYVPDHNGTAASAVAVDDDTIRVADHSDLDITGSLTLAAWLDPDPSPYAFAAVVEKDFYYSGYSLGIHGAVSADTVRAVAFLVDEGFWSDEVVPVGTGEWSHVAFTYSTAAGKGKFYFNGAPAGSTVHQVAMTASGEDLRIGTSRYRDKYKGAIDQLAIFNRALTPDEVDELFTFH